MVNKAVLETELASGVVIVGFGSPGCGACKMITPALQELAKKHSRKVIPLIPQQHRELANSYGIKLLPTLIKLVDGEEKGRLIGKQPYAVLDQFFAGTEA